MRLSCAKRIDRAKKMLVFIRNRGGNAFGFRINISLVLYVTFIRTMLEYGLALRPLTTEELAPLERLQMQALRAIYSAHKSTSKASLQLLSAIPSVKHRNWTLNASYFYRLHCYRDRNNLTLHTYRMAIERKWPANSTSMTEAVRRKNGYFRELRKPALVTRPLEPLDRIPPVTFQPPVVAKIKQAQMDEWFLQSMTELQAGSTSRMAKILPVPTSTKCRHPIILARADLTRLQFRTISQWMLGRVCNHQDCKKCGGRKIRSRQHGIDCGQVTATIRGLGLDLTPTAIQQQHGATLLDIVISKVHFKDSETIRMIVKAINKIKTECAGYSIMDDPSTATAEQELEHLTVGQRLDPATKCQVSMTVLTHYNFDRRAVLRGGNKGGRPRGRGRRR